MTTAKIYKDSDGNDCTILHMVKHEPSWEANRFQLMEDFIEKAHKTLLLIQEEVKQHPETDQNQLENWIHGHVSTIIHDINQVIK